MELREEVDKHNFVARPYQEQLLQLALKKNVIIYLPTGSGKTFIAIMAIKEMSKDTNESLENGGKRIAFLTNTVALAHQQFLCIKRSTNLRVSVYTGEMGVDNWKMEKWKKEFDNTQVIVATCQIVLDVIRHGYVTLKQFNLIIFDECHHARKEHSMHQFMDQCDGYQVSELPRIIGLTGILLTNNIPKSGIVDELIKLEKTFRAEIVTVKNLEEYKNVLVHSTKPEEIVIRYNSIPSSCIILKKTSELITECLGIIKKWSLESEYIKFSKSLSEIRSSNPIKRIEKYLKDIEYQIELFGIYGGCIAIMSILVCLEIKKRGVQNSDLRNLYRVCISYVEQIRHIFANYIESEEDTETERILNNSSEKILALIKYMENTFAKKDPKDLSCLIFVQRRHTAKCLYYIIKRWSDDNENINIKPEFMVGINNEMPESIEAILESSWNKKVLQEFERKECNLIVASSVLEEGIDIQSCNYVITFEPILSFRSYIQTKGRARMEKSVYAMFVESTKIENAIKTLDNYRKTDNLLKEFLINKSIDLTSLESDELQEIDNEKFYTKIGALLESKSAISLVNRYCMTLPCDIFTKVSVEWSKIQTNDGKTVVKILLPVQSTIKDEIIGDPKTTIKAAKRSAAYKACKALYYNKELNEHLMPISKQIIVEMVSPIYFKHWEQFMKDNKLAGTKKQKRIYNIKYPDELCSALPEIQNECYIYAFNIEIIFEKNNENEHVYNSLSKEGQYAILTKKKLPKIAPIRLYLSYGEILVHIDNIPQITIIEFDKDIEYLRNFHVMLFRDILKCLKPYLANDYRNEQNSYLIVPVTKQKDINWTMVHKYQKLIDVKPLTKWEQKSLNIFPEDYENSVVSAWYGIDQETRYMVQYLRKNLTPLSKFPNEEHENFALYFKDKYGVEVFNNNQFLLEAKPISSRLNCLHSGIGDYGSRKKKRMETILLIPELCHNFKFPADMWFKALFIPSILHRLQFLLSAENLRKNFNDFLGIINIDYNPTKLIVDHKLKRIIKDTKTNDIHQLVPILDDKNSTVRINKVTENSNNWKLYTEPCNYDRKLFEIYDLDIDYYSLFVKENIGTEESNTIMNNPYVTKNYRAIMHDKNKSQYEIKLLEIDNHNNNYLKGPEQSEILAAITAAISGDVFDMERVELLGDSFLKFSISFFLLKKHPNWNEGHLTAVKGKFVSNRNLLYCGIKINLPNIIKTIKFSPKEDWQIPLISVPKNAIDLIIEKSIFPDALWLLDLNENEILTGECEKNSLKKLEEHLKHIDSNYESLLLTFMDKCHISDKVVADTIEALLGVCVKNYGVKKTLNMLEYFHICPENSGVKDLFDTDLSSPRLKKDTTDKQIDIYLVNYKHLEDSLGYQFKDRAYLLQALTHPSYPLQQLTGCYQQLEFIGDAVLDFLISSYIYERCDHMDPGMMTDLRSALVNNVTLACIIVRKKLHLYMLSQNAELSQAINRFVKFQEANQNQVTDQVRLLIDEKETIAMADYIEVPKALGDLFESLIGAIYLDSKYNLKLTWKIIYNLMENEIIQFMQNVPLQVVRKLYEYHGAKPVFEDPIVDDDIVMVKCNFTCKNTLKQVEGFGTNKQGAKISAAKLALQFLEKS